MPLSTGDKHEAQHPDILARFEREAKVPTASKAVRWW